MKAFKQALDNQEGEALSDIQMTQLHYNIGITYFALKDYTHALPSLLQALNIKKQKFPSCHASTEMYDLYSRLPYSPEVEQLYDDIVRTYLKTDDIESALHYAEELFMIQSQDLAGHPTLVPHCYMIAKFCLALKEYDKAKDYADITIEKCPDHTDAQGIRHIALQKQSHITSITRMQRFFEK